MGSTPDLLNQNLWGWGPVGFQVFLWEILRYPKACKPLAWRTWEERMEFKIFGIGVTWWLERSQMWVADMESGLRSLALSA